MTKTSTIKMIRTSDPNTTETVLAIPTNRMVNGSELAMLYWDASSLPFSTAGDHSLIRSVRLISSLAT